MGKKCKVSGWRGPTALCSRAWCSPELCSAVRWFVSVPSCLCNREGKTDEMCSNVENFTKAFCKCKVIHNSSGISEYLASLKWALLAHAVVCLLPVLFDHSGSLQVYHYNAGEKASLGTTCVSKTL